MSWGVLGCLGVSWGNKTDRYLTPAPNLRRTRASHESQYTRYFAYNDALKNSFFPRTIPLWISLPSSVVSSKTSLTCKRSVVTL